MTDHINKGELSMEWCPIVDMIGYFMTKLTQGALFKKFRDQTMGGTPAQDPGQGKTKKEKSLKRMKRDKSERKEVKGSKKGLVWGTQPQECVGASCH